MFVDPSGNYSLAQVSIGIAVLGTLANLSAPIWRSSGKGERCNKWYLSYHGGFIAGFGAAISNFYFTLESDKSCDLVKSKYNMTYVGFGTGLGVKVSWSASLNVKPKLFSKYLWKRASDFEGMGLAYGIGASIHKLNLGAIAFANSSAFSYAEFDTNPLPVDGQPFGFDLSAFFSFGRYYVEK